MKNFIGYARMIDLDNPETSQSLINSQLNAIRNHCQKKGYNLLYIFSDDGYDNEAFDAPNWENLEDYLATEKVDGVVVLNKEIINPNANYADVKIDEWNQAGIAVEFLVVEKHPLA